MKLHPNRDHIDSVILVRVYLLMRVECLVGELKMAISWLHIHYICPAAIYSCDLPTVHLCLVGKAFNEKFVTIAKVDCQGRLQLFCML